MAEVAERCKTFESHDGAKISTSSIRTWLLQFKVEEIPLAVRVLSAVKFWGRSALSDALAFSVAQRFPSGFQALAPGAPTASGHHLTYLWDDVRGKLGSEAAVISSAAEISSELPLIIYDDNVGSGGQAGTIFGQWFGEKLESDIGEKHAEPLTEDERSRLKDIPIFLVFATGYRSGLAKIEARLSALSGNRNVSGLIMDPADLNCFRPAARVFTEPVEADRAAFAFGEAGKLAIHDMALEKRWPIEKANDRILGYGNAGGLTVFYYNVPTTTLSALWASSKSQGTRCFRGGLELNEDCAYLLPSVNSSVSELYQNLKYRNQ